MSEAAEAWAICTGENKGSGMVRSGNSGNLISQRDFLSGKIFIFESGYGGDLEEHGALSYNGENVCVLSLHHCEYVSTAALSHPACSNEIPTETKCALRPLVAKNQRLKCLETENNSYNFIGLKCLFLQVISS